MSLRVIINPAAGADQPVLAVLNRVFREREVDWDVRVSLHEHDVHRFAEEAADDGVETLAVYGGDGTVAETASALIARGSRLPLAILPGGTGNCIAQELEIPLDLEAAARLACGQGARSRAIDAIRSGDRCFFLRVGVGAEARAIRGATREQKDQLGWLAYLLGTLSELNAPAAHYSLEIDGSRFETEAVACIVANIGRVGRAGLTLAREITPFDGKLDLLVFRDGAWGALSAFGASALGLESHLDQQIDDEGSFVHRQAEHIEISTEPPQPAHGDGDDCGESPLSLTVQHRALTLRVPEEREIL